MKISSAFPSRYLKAVDLPKNKEVQVVIDHVKMEDVSGDGTEERPVVYFKGKNKGLGLNKTNAGVLQAGLGDETEDWEGREILLYVTQTPFQGNMVDCIRLRCVPEPAGEGEEESSPSF